MKKYVHIEGIEQIHCEIDGYGFAYNWGISLH